MPRFPRHVGNNTEKGEKQRKRGEGIKRKEKRKRRQESQLEVVTFLNDGN